MIPTQQNIRMMKFFSKVFFFLFFPTGFLSANENVDLTKLNTVCHKEWVRVTMPYLGYCAMENFAKLYCIDGLTQQELNQLSEELGLLEEGPFSTKMYDGRSVIQLAYVPSEREYSVNLKSGELLLKPGRYEVAFSFDKGNSINIIGEVMPVDKGAEEFELSNEKIIHFGHKKFLREFVPYMKAHSTLNITVNNQSLPSVSLMGFSKTYSSMQKCMGEAVTYDLKDPF